MKIKKTILSGIILLLLFTSLTSAQKLEDRIRQVLNVIKERVNELVLLLLCLIWYFIAALAALLIVWNGIKYLTSEDFEGRIQARRRLIQAVVGLIIVLMACPFINFLVKGTQIKEFKCECLPELETSTDSEEEYIFSSNWEVSHSLSIPQVRAGIDIKKEV